MASSGIVLGFLLMLLLPCVLTLFGGSGSEEEEMKADKLREQDPGRHPTSAKLLPRVTVQYEAAAAPARRSAAATDSANLPAGTANAIRTRQPLEPAARQRALDLPRYPEKPRTHAAPAPRRETWHEITDPVSAVRPVRSRVATPSWLNEASVPAPAARQRVKAPQWPGERYATPATATQARIETPQWAEHTVAAPVQRRRREDGWLAREEAMARVPQQQQERLEMAELDVLRARAIAVRAHAEALAAVARAARARAEAAAEEAMEAEQDARLMGQQIRRAA